MKEYKVVFWDFDGVIKDSVDVKAQIFFELFLPLGEPIAVRVRQHHIANGGMSRFEKIPLYLQWAGLETSAANIDRFCARFAQMVLPAVLAAPWVPGAEFILRGNPYCQTFIAVSATPQGQLEEILGMLDLTSCFSKVYGAPTRKGDALHTVLIDRDFQPSECLMIGDALEDLRAAEANKVPFLLRRHVSNTEIFSAYAGPSIEDFTGL